MKTLSVDLLKNKATFILNEVEEESEPVYIKDDHKTAVLMGLIQYRALMERIEELEDALDLKKAVATSTKVRPYKEYLKERKEN